MISITSDLRLTYDFRYQTMYIIHSAWATLATNEMDRELAAFAAFNSKLQERDALRACLGNYDEMVQVVKWQIWEIVGRSIKRQHQYVQYRAIRGPVAKSPGSA